MQIVSYTIDYYKHEGRRVTIREAPNCVMFDENVNKDYRGCVRDKQTAQNKNW